jgi:6 kDa early secretory antigenic target
VPSSSYLKVNFGALEEAHANLGRGVSSLDQKLADLDRDARPLVATWDGAAQQAYFEHQAAWTKAATELKLILTNIQSALRQSLDEYVSTEQQNTRLFR